MKKYSHINQVTSLVEEPSLFYSLDNNFARIASVLGGFSQMGQVVNSDIDLIDVSRRGIPKSVLHGVSSILGISMEAISSLLHVSHRTIQRKKEDDLLNVTTTEHLLEMAKVISHGIAVFSTLENFQKWLHLEIRVLDHKKPISYFDTSLGLHLIDTTLGRIEHGIYS